MSPQRYTVLYLRTGTSLFRTLLRVLPPDACFPQEITPALHPCASFGFPISPAPEVSTQAEGQVAFSALSGFTADRPLKFLRRISFSSYLCVLRLFNQFRFFFNFDCCFRFSLLLRLRSRFRFRLRAPRSSRGSRFLRSLRRNALTDNNAAH